MGEGAWAHCYKKYIAVEKLQFKEKVSVTSCGLFLDCEYAFLGASPDGIVTSSDEDRSKRLVEVKCPYKYRHTTIAETCKCSSFYCETTITTFLYQ